ncbi:MAG: TldD/PmbA family protein [Bryobacteraceae bacterium]|nr:TldD/PmbA family protein [Bryobacteraceae bacterium]
MMWTREEAQKLAERILSLSRFPECTVTLAASEQANVRFANNGITTAGFVLERSVTVTSTRDGRSGTAQTTETDPAGLEAVVRRSEELAALAPPNPEHMPPLGPQEYPETGKYDEATARARSPEMVPHIAAVIEAARKNNLVAAGFFLRSATVRAVANKNKLFGYNRSADARLTTTMRTPDGTSSGWAGQPSLRIAEIRGSEIAARAIDKCLRWRKAERLEPGAYTVVLEPTAVGDLVGRMGFAMDARAAEEGRSFLSKKGGGTRLGEKLFAEFVTLRSDPFDPRLPALPWTGELLPSRRIVWVENGVVRNLVYTRYWAAKTGKEPTGFPGSLVMEGGEGSVEDLIRQTERGLLVTRFWYIRIVNPQTLQFTGLTRDGLFVIENGKVSRPVRNLRFNDSPVRLLQNAQRAGRPERVQGAEGGSLVVPPLVSTGFQFTSVSDAV